ncbi:MAG: HEPN domain-containing protein [Anaerolineales bacterium]|nr:HEPN domain-containing protein [Anaerolineales bacterium]
MKDDTGSLSEIKLYLEAAREALASAKLNLENDFYSAAASRTYYAVFYAASALLKTKELSFSKHTAVLSAFRQHFVKTGIFSAEVSDFYKIAFDTRQTGDYELATRFEPEMLRKNLIEAQVFIDEVKKWLQQHNFLFS